VELHQSAFVSDECRKLPPLILHPFSEASSPERLTMSARASLILHGLLPGDELDVEELNRRLVEGRYCEVRMLFYLGKDVTRWLDQCMEVVARDERLKSSGIARESFAVFLVEDPPAPVREKLQGWGVVDYKAIFRRALGLHTVFATVPERESLSPHFLRNHHRYADQLYDCLIGAAEFARLRRSDFQFELYASGEYTKLLEKEWGAQ
jgi:hypothetical protein